jgi:hypothetical protein
MDISLKSSSLLPQPRRAAVVLSGSRPWMAALKWLQMPLLLIPCLGASSALPLSSAKAAMLECPGHPDCGQHNMMVVGEQTIFLSHLPMFHNEHRFQVIIEAAFEKDGMPLDGVYAEDRGKHPAERMYTLEPDKQQPFVLARLLSDDAESMRSFPATVFRGHLERGGVPLPQLANVDVKVERVVYAKEIGAEADAPHAEGLAYVLFGHPAEMFLAHRIAQPPDFDQLLGVRLADSGLTDDDLAQGVSIVLPGRTNSATDRLRAGETVTAQAQVTGSDATLPVEVEVTTEYYVEESELDPESPDPFGQTPLEQEAGF